MKLLKLLAASFSLAAATACSTAYADDGIPLEISDFAARTGLVVHQSAAAITNKYPLAGKTVKLTGKLSISGKASYMGRSFKFNAPGDKTAIQHATYTFGQLLANGSIPFKLNHLYGNFEALPDFVGSHLYVVLELYIYGKTAVHNTLILMKSK